ncbi:uncharacterized protein MEPE_00817 [Melanopsichium pennsylvanicum]|uniref:Uncharacterized protein n=2 Tax=Melanopsichium pennsylvanicum TaxID=63383 RepID=A0AAJ5C310_9BASI|nr:conserved hypothetical protein [Melanopsichium pennsylvanicum 4]SNX82111.1 uncharacterized protein MEPE_00817 [Melanopsichium pennsylvanicum]
MVATRRQSKAESAGDNSKDAKGAKRPNDEVESKHDSKVESEPKKEEDSGETKNGNAGEEPMPKKPKTSNAIPNSDVDSILEVQQSKLESYSDALTWLHSDAAWSLSNPDISDGKGEKDTAEEGGETVRIPPEPYENKREGAGGEGHLSYPNSDLTAFQTLMCAILLSKPISHRLGLRTIETLLNKPFYFRTADDLINAENEGRRAALWEARTQHKEKTAVQLGSLADGIVSLCGDDKAAQASLRPILDKAVDQTSNKDGSFEVAEQVKEVLIKEINGLGPGGVEIFLRRVQSQWGSVFPFADERALNAAVKFDLISEGDVQKGRKHATRKLAEKVAEHVGFPLEDAKKDSDEEAECGRWWFVRTLDVLIGLDIEKKLDEAAKQATTTK